MIFCKYCELFYICSKQIFLVNNCSRRICKRIKNTMFDLIKNINFIYNKIVKKNRGILTLQRPTWFEFLVMRQFNIFYYIHGSHFIIKI